MAISFDLFLIKELLAILRIFVIPFLLLAAPCLITSSTAVPHLLLGRAAFFFILFILSCEVGSSLLDSIALFILTQLSQGTFGLYYSR